MSTTMTLNEFLQHVEGVYQSIDVRTAAVKSNGVWQNALTVIQFSCEDPKDIRERQDNKKAQWERIETSNFRVAMAPCHIDLLENLIDFFAKRSLPFYGPDDVHFDRSINLLSLVGHFESYGYTKRKAGPFPFFEAYDGRYCPLLKEDQLQREIKSQTLYEAYELIRELLEVDFHKDLAFDLIVTAPFYAHIEHYDFGEQKCKVKIKFHKDIKDLAVRVTVRGSDQDDAPLKDKANSTMKLDESNELDNGMMLWSKDFELPNATPNNYLGVNLIQTNPTALDVEKISYPRQIKDFLESKKHLKNPLLAAFRRFCSEEDLESYTANPGKFQPPSPKKPSSAFEGAVSWILALCGFKPIWLGWTDLETLQEGKIQHLRLDILAYYEKENTLLLVNCTIGDPAADIDRLNSIRHKLQVEVFKGTSVQFRPCIFSPQPKVDIAKQNGDKVGVTVFGAEDMQRILNHLKVGNSVEALYCFGFTGLNWYEKMLNAMQLGTE